MTPIIAMYLMGNIIMVLTIWGFVPWARKTPGFYKDHWLIDSEASDHITPYLEDFSNLAQGERFASTANGSIIKMHGPGTIVLKQDHRSTPPVTLTGVWYAPEAAHHLLSVTALTHQGF